MGINQKEKSLVMITEKQKIQQRIAEYESIINSLEEEITLYEGWIKEAQDEIAELEGEEETDCNL